MNKSVSEILIEMRATNSKLDKLRILTENKDNELLKNVLFYAYNPFFNYYLKKTNGILERAVENTDYHIRTTYDMYQDMFDFLDKLRARKITGHSALNEAADVYSFLNDDIKKIFLLILTKDLRAGFSASTVNKVWKKLIPEFKVALASGEKEIKHIQFPAICQLKGDGRRTIVFYDVSNDNFEIYTRSGKRDGKLEKPEIAAQFSILSCMIRVQNSCESFVFDCEAIMEDSHGDPFDRKISNGILNRKEISAENLAKVRFLIWDVISKEEFEDHKGDSTYGERFNHLSNAFEQMEVDKTKHKNLKIIPSQVVFTLVHVKRIAEEYISEGFEGAILKNIDAPYKGKRTRDQIKIKAEHEADLIVVDWQEGTGIMKDYMGALVCESARGKLKVSVGTGFSYHDRGFTIVDTDTMETKRVSHKMDKENIVGKIITVKYNEVIENAAGEHSLFLPRFIEVRDDKEFADSFEKITEEM